MGCVPSDVCAQRVIATDESTRASSSTTSAYACVPASAPPYSVGKGIPIRSSSARRRTISYGNDLVRSSSSATGAISRSANSRTVACTSLWSSDNARSIASIIALRSAGMTPPSPQDPPDPALLAAQTTELDAIGSGRSAPAPHRPGAIRAPHVKLGRIERGGLSPAIMAIVERGVRRRPVLAQGIEAEVELEFEEAYPPVRVVFGQRTVLVEDGPAVAPDLRVRGALPDLISLMVTPLLRGVPNPINARGRAALGMVVLRRIRFEGRLGLMRRLIRVICV